MSDDAIKRRVIFAGKPRCDLYLGDCLEILPLVGKVDAVATDIPYAISQKSNGLRVLDYGAWDHRFDEIGFTKQVLAITNNSIYIWCGDRQVSSILKVYAEAGWLDRTLHWVKPNPTVINGDKLWLPGAETCAFGKAKGSKFNGQCHKGWWLLTPDQERYHPNQKPLSMIRQQVAMSTDLGDAVLDPFMGSGTTGVACMKLGRRFIGIEIDEGYFNIAVRRITEAREEVASRLPFEQPERDEQLTLIEP